MKYKYIRIIIYIAFPLIALVVLGWSFFIAKPLPCVINSVTGLYCPSCGATRAVMAVLHGDFKSAMHSNAFAAVLALPTAVFMCVVFLHTFFKKAICFSERTLLLIVICIAVFLGLYIIFGIIRNIPYYPFIELVPI